MRYDSPLSLNNKKLNKIYQTVISKYHKKLEGAKNEAASDVYGGITNNTIVGSYRQPGEDYLGTIKMV